MYNLNLKFDITRIKPVTQSTPAPITAVYFIFIFLFCSLAFLPPPTLHLIPLTGNPAISSDK